MFVVYCVCPAIQLSAFDCVGLVRGSGDSDMGSSDMSAIQPKHFRVVTQDPKYRVIEVRLDDLPLYLESRNVRMASYEFFPPVQDEVLMVVKKEDGNVGA